MKSVLMVLFLIIPIALLTGLVASQGVKFSIFWIAALGGLGLLALSNKILIWSVTILDLLVIGQLIYFARIEQATWIAFGFGILMFLKMPMVYADSPFSKCRATTPLALPVLSFIFCVLLSMLINTTDFIQAIRAAKSYIFLWGIFFLIAYWGVRLEVLNQIWRFCIWVVFFQLPLILYQYLVIVPTRSNLGGKHGVSWDAVVGGFGGDPMGGGASGTMAWFITFGIILSVGMFRRDLMGKWFLIAVIITSLISIGLAEVKVVVILFPVGMSALLFPYFRKNPFLTLAAFVASFSLGLMILILYSALYGQSAGFKADSFDIMETLNDAFFYSLDPNFVNLATGEIGRVAAVVHWWNENGWDDLLHTLFGHGPGSSAISPTFGAGEVARKYPSFDLNRSTLNVFLWDIGLMGVFSYLLIIVKASSLAFKTSKIKNLDSFQVAVLEAIFGGLLTIIIMLPYSKDVSENSAISLLLMLFFGYVSLSSSELVINAKLKK